MLRVAKRPAFTIRVQNRVLTRLPVRLFRTHTGSEPLRILFCGSDEFSIASLEVLHNEFVCNPTLIKSIDVLTRAPKRVGRGLKTVQPVPLMPFAERLRLPVYQPEDLNTWKMMPEGINLIVAVSYGKFIPGHILNRAKYGGLNIHPSMLPDLRGASPIQHTILLNRAFTGVTLQLLSKRAFDEGRVLAQTPLPGIPVPPDSTTQSLRDMLAPIGAEMLRDGIRNQLYLKEGKDMGWKPTPEQMERLGVASKLDKNRQQIKWALWSAGEFDRHQRALGKLWSLALHRCGDVRRLIVERAEIIPTPEFVAAYLRRFNAATQSSEDELSDEDKHVPKVIWFTQSKRPLKVQPTRDSENSEGEGEDISRLKQIELPYFEAEDGAVIIPPVQGGGCVKIHMTKEEGSRARPAAEVLAKYHKADVHERLGLSDVVAEVAMTPVRFFIEDLNPS